MLKKLTTAIAVVVAALGMTVNGSPVNAASRVEVNHMPQVGGGSAECRGKPHKDFGSGGLCADSGFRRKHTFLFPNWGGTKFPNDNMAASEFVALFGPENVCATFANNQCTLTVGALSVYNQMSNALAGGRCEGMVVLNALIAAQVVKPPALQKRANGVAQLNPSGAQIQSLIKYWWASQFSQSVIDETANVRAQGLKPIVDRLIQALNRGLYATIGIYTKTAGHALLPVGVVRQPDGVYRIITYDSNLPNRLTFVAVDLAKDQWSYNFGTTNPSQAAKPWTGKSGSLDYTPMSSRVGVSKCSFCNDKAASNSVVKVSAVTLPSTNEILRKFAG